MASALTSAFVKQPAFVAYLTAGYPTKAATVPAMLAMQEVGVNVIEVGVPFSDPLADGGTIQRANQVALQNVVLMGYYNPFLHYGEEKLVDDCADAGVNGFIVVDLPCEDATAFVAACDRRSLGFVPLVAPTTLPDRLPSIAKVARGFVYCVSVTGVTGARAALPVDLSELLARVKARISLPVAVGFGISTRAQVEAIGSMTEGVVMGSAIVNKLGETGVDGMRTFLQTVITAP